MEMLRVDKDVKDHNVVRIDGDVIKNVSGSDVAAGVFHSKESVITFATILMDGSTQTDRIRLPAGVRQKGFDQVNISSPEEEVR
jgi:hypothetical protein